MLLKKLVSAAPLGLKCVTHIYSPNAILNTDPTIFTNNFVRRKVV